MGRVISRIFSWIKRHQTSFIGSISRISSWVERHQAFFTVILSAALVAANIFLWISINKQVHIMRKQTRVANESLTEARKAGQAARDSANAAEKSASIAQQSYDTGLRAQLTIMSRREIFVSLPPIGVRSDIQVSADDRIRKSSEQMRMTGAKIRPRNADHDELYLVFRNLSHRPTAILDIRVKDKEGKDLGVEIRKRQFTLPIKIGPWDAEGRDIRIENSDATRMAYVEIEDIDRKIFCIRPTEEWTNATEAKKCPP